MDQYPSGVDFTFAALAHPTRRRILQLLEEGACCVTELAEEFPASLNVVSKHVRSLERAGLVERSVEGRVHRLRLNAAPLVEAASFIVRYRQLWERQFDQLAGYLDTMAAAEKRRLTAKPRSKKS
ncbi:MAG: winged helix-turn-helix transcriptional regulator [Opitutae bacterium]|nr:winged helix-turn-helix transcriptional regulator [Opitutae bacterium]